MASVEVEQDGIEHAEAVAKRTCDSVHRATSHRELIDWASSRDVAQGRVGGIDRIYESELAKLDVIPCGEAHQGKINQRARLI